MTQYIEDMKHTKTEEISAANARISAQETVLGQALSTAVLIRFTTSKPLIELLFGKAPCSLTIVVVSFNKIEASQPFHKHKHIDIKFMSYKYQN
jgi:uncharacterized membrane protein